MSAQKAYYDTKRAMNQTVDFETANELLEVGFTWAKWEKLPTALEIIAQMPIPTTIGTLVDPKNTDTIWECTFPLPMMQHDSRFHDCPHKCAALAYIAWAKGRAAVLAHKAWRTKY